MGNFNRDRGGRGGGFNRGGDRRGGRGGGFNRDRSDRPAMHKAVCDACHKNCEVPFKPTGNKPIFCSDCFSKQGGGNDRSSRFSGGDRKPRFESRGSSSTPNQDSKDILKGIKTLNYKLDELIKVLGHTTPTERTADADDIPKKVKATPKKVAKKKSSKKRAVAPKIIISKKTPKKKPVAKKPVKKNAKKK